jgi:hypothetical protein
MTTFISVATRGWVFFRDRLKIIDNWVFFRDRLKIIDNWVKLAFVIFNANTADESFGGGGGLPLYDAYGEWNTLF